MLNDIASLVCHQLDDRSLHIGSAALPLCARCTGVYAGFFIGALFLLLARRGSLGRLPSGKAALVAVGFLALFVVEALGERLQGWAASNSIRLACGCLVGVALSLVLVPLAAHFLLRNPAEGPGRGLPAWTIWGAVSLALVALSWFLPLLWSAALFSATGLVALYLCLNLAISGALLDAKNRPRSPARILALLGLTLGLFVAEGTFFRLVQ